jgi:ribosomal protein L40E
MQYSQYVTAESLGDIPTGIASVAQQGEEDVADTVLSFVQNVGYVLSGYTHYNTLYPVETLATGGVCDDLSVLYATMMVAIGFKVIVVWYPKMIDLGGSKVTHVNVGVHLTIPPEHTTWGNYTYFVLNGVDYYTAETTSDGWRVGDLAYSLRNTNDYLEEAPAPSSPLVILTMTKTEYVTQTSVSLRTLTSTVTQSAVESPVTGTIIGGLIVASVLIAILAYRFGKGKEILTEGLGGGAHQVIVQGAPRSLQWTCNCGRRISATVLPGEVVECRGCGQKHNESKILEIQSSSSVDKSTIFCRECGAKIPRSSKFCNECGVRLT